MMNKLEDLSDEALSQAIRSAKSTARRGATPEICRRAQEQLERLCAEREGREVRRGP